MSERSLQLRLTAAEITALRAQAQAAGRSVNAQAGHILAVALKATP